MPKHKLTQNLTEKNCQVHFSSDTLSLATNGLQTMCNKCGDALEALSVSQRPSLVRVAIPASVTRPRTHPFIDWQNSQSCRLIDRRQIKITSGQFKDPTPQPTNWTVERFSI